MTARENIGALLLPWLKAHADDTAQELRSAGWEEDERGLWQYNGKGRRYHILDAAEVERCRATEGTT